MLKVEQKLKRLTRKKLNMNPRELINQEAQKLLAKAKESVKNLQKITIDEAWKILQLLIASLVQIIESIATDLSGPDKKAIALKIINEYYDTIFTVIDIPFVPSFVEPIIHRYIKMILMAMVSSSIDATVTIFRSTGVFIKKEIQI